LRNMRILVVDDDAMAAAIVSITLEEAGHEVTVAGDGEEALQLVASNAQYAVIISDLNMPGIDGIELSRQIKGGGVNAPFILLSGGAPDKLREMAPGIAACVAKDETLADTIADTVARVVFAFNP